MDDKERIIGLLNQRNALIHQRDRIRAERDDLLAACEALIRTIEQYATNGDTGGLLSVQDARAAIRKAQEAP